MTHRTDKHVTHIHCVLCILESAQLACTPWCTPWCTKSSRTWLHLDTAHHSVVVLLCNTNIKVIHPNVWYSSPVCVVLISIHYIDGILLIIITCLFVPVCSCLSLSVPVSPRLSLFVPVCPCLSPFVPVCPRLSLYPGAQSCYPRLPTDIKQISVQHVASLQIIRLVSGCSTICNNQINSALMIIRRILGCTGRNIRTL